jgi:hypothetical protein
MLFCSALFLVCLLPAVVVVHHLLPRCLRNAHLLLASALFNAWGAPRFVFVVLATSSSTSAHRAFRSSAPPHPWPLPVEKTIRRSV